MLLNRKIESAARLLVPPRCRVFARSGAAAGAVAIALAASLAAPGCASTTRRKAVPFEMQTRATVSGFPEEIRYFPRDAGQLAHFEKDFVDSWTREKEYRKSQ